ncbi:MAG: hypothetical protein NTW30_00110 [Candidatus Aenigmarchaeota archaeon]|nr:hypothetical protein [Candidatus Aenigmarchaeota archaeon]
MNKFMNFTKTLFLFSIYFLANVSATSIRTDKGTYNFRETVRINGSEFFQSKYQEVAIKVWNPKNGMSGMDQIYPDGDGNFSTDFFIIPSPDIVQGFIEGTWTITANTSAESAQTTFSVSSGTSTTTTTSTSTTTTTIINSINYIEVNGTVFIQPEVINITGWSGNLSSETYLWSNYTGTIQSMPPNGTGVQTNITISSNLNLGVYEVSCNSTGNSTLASKTFTVATASATTTTQGDGNNNNNQGTTTTTIPETTTTITNATTTTSITSTNVSSTTITIPEEETKGMKTWYVIPIILIFVLVGIVLWYLNYMKKPAESTEFEKIKEKWSQ